VMMSLSDESQATVFMTPLPQSELPSGLFV
jgi:hypothetical protein